MRVKVARLDTKKALVAAVQKWARDHAKRELGRPIRREEIAFIREEIAPIAAPDKRSEKLARKAHQDLARAAAALVSVGKSAPGETGWRGEVAGVAPTVCELVKLLERADAEALDAVSSERTWPSRTVLVQEFGDPRRKGSGFELRARWLWYSKREPSVDDLIAVSVLGGLYDSHRLEGITLREMTLAHALDVERRAIRETIRDRLAEESHPKRTTKR